tara:strand:- start:729 stop:908 length:180 start_codon:yes stop_codon:yes gene_type:complete
MKITNWEDYESLEEELAIKESRNKKKKKVYSNEEYTPSGKKKFPYRKNDKNTNNNSGRI